MPVSGGLTAIISVQAPTPAQACRRFRLLRTRVRLGERARETLEAELARMLRELHDPAAPAVDLMLPSARQG
jgi:hypothetical protein